MRLKLLLFSALVLPALSRADSIQITVYGAPLSSTLTSPADITFLLSMGTDEVPPSIITKQLGLPYNSIVFTLPARPIGYFVGQPEGALYIWLSPDTTSINLLQGLQLFAPPVPPSTEDPDPVVTDPVVTDPGTNNGGGGGGNGGTGTGGGTGGDGGSNGGGGGTNTGGGGTNTGGGGTGGGNTGGGGTNAQPVPEPTEFAALAMAAGVAAFRSQIHRLRSKIGL